MHKNTLILIIFFMMALAVPPGTALSGKGDVPSNGSAKYEETTLAPALNPGLNHLLDLVKPGGSAVFDRETATYFERRCWDARRGTS